MKRLIFFITTLLLLAISAQGQKVFTLENIQIQDNLDVFINDMTSKGFVVDSTNAIKGFVYLHGDMFKGKLANQTVTVEYAPKSKLINSVYYQTQKYPRKDIVKIWNKTLQRSQQ